MGLFRSRVIFRDRVAFDGSQKRLDIIRSLRSSISKQFVPIAVIHFHDSMTFYTKLFATNDLRSYQIQNLSELDSMTASGWNKKCDIILMDSNIITPSDLKTSRKPSPGTKFDLHLLEKYPIPEPDQRVLDLVNVRRDIESPIAYVALDEPWLLEIMGDRLLSVFEKLNVDKTEVLENSLISSSLRNAQLKIAERVKRDFPQDSLEKWLSSNLSD